MYIFQVWAIVTHVYTGLMYLFCEYMYDVKLKQSYVNDLQIKKNISFCALSKSIIKNIKTTESEALFDIFSSSVP